MITDLGFQFHNPPKQQDWILPSKAQSTAWKFEEAYSMKWTWILSRNHEVVGILNLKLSRKISVRLSLVDGDLSLSSQF